VISGRIIHPPAKATTAPDRNGREALRTSADAEPDRSRSSGRPLADRERIRAELAKLHESTAWLYREITGETAPEPAVQLRDADRVQVCPRSFTVRWGGRECFLGPGLLCDIARAIFAADDWPLAHAELLSAAWGGRRVTPGAVRLALCRLRCKLVDAGMPELARRIKSRLGVVFVSPPPVAVGNENVAPLKLRGCKRSVR